MYIYFEKTTIKVIIIFNSVIHVIYALVYIINYITSNVCYNNLKDFFLTFILKKKQQHVLTFFNATLSGSIGPRSLT